MGKSEEISAAPHCGLHAGIGLFDLNIITSLSSIARHEKQPLMIEKSFIMMFIFIFAYII
jgi:hypothetical protein